MQKCFKTNWFNIQNLLPSLISSYIKISLCFTGSFKTGIRCTCLVPQQITLRHTLEKTKKKSLKICTKNCSSDYAYHLNLTNLPFLSTRRLYLKLTFLFQILNGSFVYLNAPLVKRNLRLNLRNSNNIQFKRPICHTNAYLITTYHVKYRAVLHCHLLNVVLCPIYLCK